MQNDSFSLSISRNWKYIRPVREFIREFMSVRYNNDETAYDLAFIASELLENAVKYAEKGTISLECAFNDVLVEMSVTNDLQEERLGKLKQKLRLLSEKTMKEQYSRQFESPTFWENERGAIGLIMINERCAGKVRLDYENPLLTITCSVATGGNP